MVTSSMPPPPPPFVARRAFRDLDAPIAGVAALASWAWRGGFGHVVGDDVEHPARLPALQFFLGAFDFVDAGLQVLFGGEQGIHRLLNKSARFLSSQLYRLKFIIADMQAHQGKVFDSRHEIHSGLCDGGCVVGAGEQIRV